MFRSLHRKLVLILVLLIVSVMAVVGTFLINSINTFYLNSFYEQMQAVFTTDTIRSMQEAAAEPGTDGLKTIIDAHKSRLGIDDYRNYAILDSEGGFLDGSNPNVSVTRTSNVIAAMAGETGTRSAVSDSIMDIAVPLDKNGDGAVDYIVYIADNKAGDFRSVVAVLPDCHAGDDVRPSGGYPAVLPAQQDHHHADRAHHRGGAVDRGRQL